MHELQRPCLETGPNHSSRPSTHVSDFPHDLPSFTDTVFCFLLYDPGNERRPVFLMTDLAIDILVVTSLGL